VSTCPTTQTRHRNSPARTAPIYVILDDLSSHKDETIRRWARRNRVELCFHPTYESWANPIEAHFGHLRQFPVANSDHRNHTLKPRTLHAYPRWRNTNARHPDVLAAQRRERARIHSAKGLGSGGRPAKVACPCQRHWCQRHWRH